ncbi:MAG TPA: helix-turn-helix domain-containing protein [Stenotrophomonas sp.]|nr:helix-turn-helix domain-containing protein [Stenotrophomonas sp.]
MDELPQERPFLLVWRSAVLNSTLTATQKLCLLVLAEWADNDGTNCWPAMASIAAKASVNEKTVRRAMDEVAPLGWFDRSHRRTKKGWKQFEYTLRLPPAADTESCRKLDAPGTVSAIGDPSTGHSVHMHRTLCPDAPGTVSDDLALDLAKDLAKGKATLLPAKVSKPKSSKLTLNQWLESVDEETVTKDVNRVMEYVKVIGLPEAFEELAWEAFRERYTTNPSYSSKRYASWPQVYRNAIEGNWLKLWFIDNAGEYQLSTQGKQADRQYETGIVAKQADPYRLPRLQL